MVALVDCPAFEPPPGEDGLPKIVAPHAAAPSPAADAEVHHCRVTPIEGGPASDDDRKREDEERFALLLAGMSPGERLLRDELDRTWRKRQDLLRAELAVQQQLIAIARRMFARGLGREEATKVAQKELAAARKRAVPAKAGKAAPAPTPMQAAYDDHAAGQLQALVLLHAARLPVERQLAELAQQLPAWDAWGRGVRGFGPLSLALIAGETYDLRRFPTHGKVFKWMGLAVGEDGRAQRRVAGEGGRAQGYDPQKRSLMHVIGENLLRQNGDGPYKAFYDAEKARLADAHPDWKPIQAHKDALRRMEKRFLRDLWQAWRDAEARPC